MIDKYYFVKGGAERYMFELIDELEKNGHEVIPFSMKHERIFDTPYSDYFVDNIEFNQTSLWGKLVTGLKSIPRIIYSKHAQKKLQSLIDKIKPDLAHLHMIDHQISPSILVTLKKNNIPIIQTVHQYKMVCPNYRFYIEHKNQICEKCISGHFYHAMVEKCQKNSFAASAIVAVESYVHRWMNIYKHVDIFHVPSHFMGKKIVEGGTPQGKVKHQFYSIDIASYPFTSTFENYFVYFGRIAGEKGMHHLIDALEKSGITETILKIIGEGPLREDVEKYTKELGLTNVEFLGYQSGEELKKIIANSRFVVVPSEWYDNSPLVIYESAAMGKPVVCSDLGGMPELVEHNKTGRVYKASDSSALAQHIQELCENDELIKEYSKNSRQKAEQEFSWQAGYEHITGMYNQILEH